MYDTTEQKKDTEIIVLNSIKFDTNEFSVSQLFSVVLSWRYLHSLSLRCTTQADELVYLTTVATPCVDYDKQPKSGTNMAFEIYWPEYNFKYLIYCAKHESE